MPNHVRNVWKISHIPEDKVQYVLNKISMVYNKEGKRIIDFDLIIPEPKYKIDCPKDCIVNKYSHVIEDKDRPWFNWYAWRNRYWNTKWNAYDGYIKIGKTYIQLVFNTAWSFVRPVAYELAKQLGYDLECKYADEDYGSNCGIFTYNAETKEFAETMAVELEPNPRDWAKRLWNTY